MIARKDDLSTGLDRFNALLAWWGTPDAMGSGDVETQTKRFQVLVSDLSQAFSEASSCQIKTLIAANEHLTGSLQDVLHCRQPQELMVVQSRLATEVMETLAAQAKVWVELTQKVHDCCAGVVREAVTEAGGKAGPAAPDGPTSGAGRSAIKKRAKRTAEA